MKKAISLALAALIATMALGLSAFAAPGDPTATLESKEINTTTTEVVLNLSVADYPSATTVTVVIPSLPAGVTLTKFEDKHTGLGIQTGGNALNIPYRMSWNTGNGNAYTVDGVIATLTFSIAGPLAVGDTIEIEIADEVDGNVDGDLENFTIDPVKAVLTVVPTPLEEIIEIIEGLIDQGDLTEEQEGEFGDILDELGDLSDGKLDSILEVLKDIDGDTDMDDVIEAIWEIINGPEVSEDISTPDGSSTDGGTSTPVGPTPTGEMNMVAAAIATVAIAGAAIVALKKRK